MDFMLNIVITTTVTAIGILFLKWIFRDKMSPKLHAYIWIILLVRMLIPIFPQSQLSVFNMVPTIENVVEREEVLQSIEDTNTINENAYLTGDFVSSSYNKSFSMDKKTAEYIKIIWTSGAVVLFVYYLGIYAMYSRRLKAIDVCEDEEISKLLNAYKDKMNIRCDVLVKVLGDLPLLKGILRPVIVLPEGYKDEDLQHMLVHELCHLKYNHIFLNFISTVFLCINWYNPIIWRAYFVFKSDLELLCDQRVIELTGDKTEYAKLLMRNTTNNRRSLPMTTCMNNGKNEIKRRIYFMANFKKPSFLWTVIIVTSIAFLGVGCLSSSVGSKGSSSFEFKNINSLMGKDREEVLKNLKIDLEKDVTVDNLGDEERVIIDKPMKINGENCEVFLDFYNGMLTAVNYIFDSNETGYNYAKVIQGQAEEIYGESITYPESENRLDNLKEFKEEEIEDSIGKSPYYESWATEDDEEMLKKLAGDRDIKDIENLYGIDIVLNLSFSKDDKSLVNVRYSAARNPRGEWRIAP